MVSIMLTHHTPCQLPTYLSDIPPCDTHRLDILNTHNNTRIIIMVLKII